MGSPPLPRRYRWSHKLLSSILWQTMEVDDEEYELVKPLSSLNLSAFNGASSDCDDDEFDDASESLEELMRRGEKKRQESTCSSSTASTSTISETDEEDKSQVLEEEEEEASLSPVPSPKVRKATHILPPSYYRINPAAAAAAVALLYSQHGSDSCLPCWSFSSCSRPVAS